MSFGSVAQTYSTPRRTFSELPVNFLKRWWLKDLDPLFHEFSLKAFVFNRDVRRSSWLSRHIRSLAAKWRTETGGCWVYTSDGSPHEVFGIGNLRNAAARCSDPSAAAKHFPRSHLAPCYNSHWVRSLKASDFVPRGQLVVGHGGRFPDRPSAPLRIPWIGIRWTGARGHPCCWVESIHRLGVCSEALRAHFLEFCSFGWMRRYRKSLEHCDRYICCPVAAVNRDPVDNSGAQGAAEVTRRHYSRSGLVLLL